VSWVPLFLTVIRIPMAALVWLAPGSPAYVLSLMAVAGVTDMLDGWLARRYKHHAGTPDLRDAGAWLDPLCDKVFIVSALAAVVWAARPPLWTLPLIASREILQAPLLGYLRLKGVLRRYDFRASAVGKLATIAQFAAVAAILLRHPSALPLAWAAGVVGVAASVYYFARAARLSP
jgi:cardiolipin synthase (CMP-forming)